MNTSTSTSTSTAGTPLISLLDHWVQAGIITAEQAQQIRADARAHAQRGSAAPPPAEPRAASVVVEALGYLGGVLVLVASLLLTVQLWDDLSVGWRLALPAGGTVLLLLAGLPAPGRDGSAAHRVRAVLWVLSVGSLAAFVSLLSQELLTGQSSETVTTITATAAAVYAGALWTGSRHLLQHVAFFVSVCLAAMAAVSLVGGDTLPGLVLWLLGVCWLALGWRGVLTPPRAAVALGAVAALLGAQIAMLNAWGNLLGVLTAAALVLLAVRASELGLLAVASLGTLSILPRATTFYFPGETAAPLALLAGGVVLVAAALRTARRRAPDG